MVQYLTLSLSYYLLLRLYSVLRANDASPLPPSNTPTSPDAITPEPKSNIIPLAVGIPFGLLTLVIVVLGALYVRRRRSRKSAAHGGRTSALLETRAIPLYVDPPAQDDQLPDAPQESKRHSRPLSHGSTPSWGSPMTAAFPAMSIGVPESEIAPSYEPFELHESGPAQ